MCGKVASWTGKPGNYNAMPLDSTISWEWREYIVSRPAPNSTRVKFLCCTAPKLLFLQVLLKTCSKQSFCFLVGKHLIREMNNFLYCNCEMITVWQSHGKWEKNYLEMSSSMKKFECWPLCIKKNNIYWFMMYLL